MHAVGVTRWRSPVGWVVLAVPFFSAGCTPFIPADGYTAVDGVVVDERGAPLGGVEVIFRPQSSQEDMVPPLVHTTDDQGRFFVGSTHRPVVSQFIVEAKKEGYRPATITVQGCEIHRGVRIVLVSEPGGPAVMSGKPKG